jgi:hypothetical protein
VIVDGMFFSSATTLIRTLVVDGVNVPGPNEKGV